MGGWLRVTALQEKAALVAVKAALQTLPESHHITHYLDCYRYTAHIDGNQTDYMHYITKYGWLILLTCHHYICKCKPAAMNLFCI